MPRRYIFEHMLNARDLGGYASARGGETRWRRFIRADSTHALSPDEARALVEMGVTDVIDLRGAVETVRRPSALVNVPGLRYKSIPLAVDIASLGIAPEEANTGADYLGMAENAHAVREIMSILADAEGIALFHCTAGKDRTGIIAALLLLLAGVDEDDVVADYMVSEWYIRRSMEGIRRLHPGMPEHYARSRPAYMCGFLDLLRQKYGSVEAYLAAMGVSPETCGRLRDKLLEE